MMSNMRPRMLAIGVGLCLVSTTGCGGDEKLQFDPPVLGNLVALEGFRDPEISYDPELGTTTIVVQLVARDGDENPLHSADLDVNLLVDGRPIDVEGLLQEDSEALASNLHLTLALDTSYSMLQHQPAAFLPMLSAARRTTSAGKALYVDRPGSFDWDLLWFAEKIYHPVETTAETFWLENDIERIPAPGPGTFTKLHAAIAEAVKSSAEHAAQINAGFRDQHLVVVFSDGADNYSWFDNAQLQGSGSIGTNRSYEWQGAAPVTRADVERLLRDNPQVQLHVMGLGSQVNDNELRALARNGRGRYFKNVDASEVDVLFEQVTREFTSVQTHGATIPLPPGQYEFKVVARRADTGAEASYRFEFVGGQVGAGVVR